MAAVCRYARGRAALSLFLTTVLGLAQGIGLFMLIPMLHLIGFGGTDDTGGVTYVVDRILARLGFPLTLPAVLGIYLVLVAGHAAASRFRDVLNTEIIQGFTCFLRNDLYEDLTRVDWLSFTRIRASDITHVLTAGLEMVGFGTQQLLLLVSTMVIAGAHFGVALTLSLAMTALALGVGALLLLVLRPFNRRAMHTGEKLLRAREEMFAVVADHLSGMKVAKSYGLESRYAGHFHVATGRLVDQFVGFAPGECGDPHVLRHRGRNRAQPSLPRGRGGAPAPSRLRPPHGLPVRPAVAAVIPGPAMPPAPPQHAALLRGGAGSARSPGSWAGAPERPGQTGPLNWIRG